MVDFLRNAFQSTMRPDGSDPSGDFVVEWFRVPEDRAALELPTSFASSTWDDYPFIEKIGELRKSRVWVRGTEALAVPAMEPPGRCGAPELWLFGFPAGAEGCETDPITGECLECGPMAIGQEVATAEGVDDGNLQQEVATAESADQWATTGIAAEVADAFGADSVLSPALPFVGMAFGLLAGELAYAVATAEAIDAGHTRVEVDSVASAFGADVDLVQREPAASEAFGTVCSIETIGIGAAEAFAVGTGDLFPRQAIAAPPFPRSWRTWSPRRPRRRPARRGQLGSERRRPPRRRRRRRQPRAGIPRPRRSVSPAHSLKRPGRRSPRRSPSSGGLSAA